MPCYILCFFSYLLFMFMTFGNNFFRGSFSLVLKRIAPLHFAFTIGIRQNWNGQAKKKTDNLNMTT